MFFLNKLLTSLPTVSVKKKYLLDFFKEVVQKYIGMKDEI